uniref:Uncharacterized protein n=1 Tax=Arundo donax TaxID=35708 RepID=A0A0A9ASK9_ARUDO
MADQNSALFVSSTPTTPSLRSWISCLSSLSGVSLSTCNFDIIKCVQGLQF